MKNRVVRFFESLKKKHGNPRGQWSLWCKRSKSEKEREEVIIGAILTQRTNWQNVERAILNLKKAGVCSLKDIYKMGEKRLAGLIKPSGFYKAKACYLFCLAEFVIKNYKGVRDMKRERTEILRKRLLELKGIGPETCDSILLYALDKPVFVIDEYTKRLVKRHNLSSKTDYYALQGLFEKSIERDYKLYQDFHALIVIEAQSLNKR